jgi:hypothetical protein
VAVRNSANVLTAASATLWAITDEDVNDMRHRAAFPLRRAQLLGELVQIAYYEVRLR